MLNTKSKLIISITLVLLGVACRVLPHWWNFTPIAAIALFAGFYLGKRYAIILPILTMMISDLFVGFYQWQLMAVVYLSFCLIGLIANFARKHKNFEVVVASSIVGSFIFFLLTNFAVWQFSPWYAKSLTGLIQAYTLALPFFRATLVGDLFYTFILFGSYEAVVLLLTKSKLVCQKSY